VPLMLHKLKLQSLNSQLENLILLKFRFAKLQKEKEQSSKLLSGRASSEKSMFWKFWSNGVIWIFFGFWGES
ncbi:MAG: hypothetical protein RL609_425, partial [Bacteroidota bacterium]